MTETQKHLTYLDDQERKKSLKKAFENQRFHEFCLRFFRHWTWEQVVEERNFYNALHKTRQTIRKNIKAKSLDIWFTLTLDPKSQDNTKDGLSRVQDRLRKTFKLLDVEYCVMPEYHQESCGIHFHGFIKVHNENLLQRKLYAPGTKKEGRPVSHYGRPVYMLDALEKNFGYCTLKRLNSKAIQDKVYYMTKYAVKSTDFKLMSSRGSSKPRFNAFERIKALFGDFVTWED